MEIQNIILEFNGNHLYSMYNDKIYTIDSDIDLTEIKTELNTVSEFTVASAVIQYTYDQHFSSPRVVIKSEDDIEVKIILITDIIYDLDLIKNEVESNINQQIQE